MSTWIWDNASVKYMCHHQLNELRIVQFLIKEEKHWPTPPRSETLWWSVPWGLIYSQKKTISKCVFLFGWATTCIVFKCEWPWMPYWLVSRLNGFVKQCYCHKTKKPGFNGLASPHEGRVQGGFQLGTVEVVFDQLLSAWLGVNRWTNHTHTHTQTRAYILLYYQFSTPISFKVALNFNPYLDLNCLFQKLLRPCNGSTTSANSHTHTSKPNY